MIGGLVGSDKGAVGAVVVTYHRPEVLRETLRGLACQTRPPDLIVVVDNGGGVDPVVNDAASSVGASVISMPGNPGFGAGLAQGMDWLRSRGVDLYWLMDDDSTSDAFYLERVLRHVAPEVGIVSSRGGHVRHGRIRHTLHRLPEGAQALADFCLVDGAIVTAAAVERAGLPRSDLFMMMEDFEYSTRIAKSGFAVLIAGGDRAVHRHMGSSSSWRAYYQARNHLRIAFDRRSLSLIFGWLIREAGLHATGLLLRGDVQRSRLRLRGSVDACRNRMGRTPGLP